MVLAVIIVVMMRSIELVLSTRRPGSSHAGEEEWVVLHTFPPAPLRLAYIADP